MKKYLSPEAQKTAMIANLEKAVLGTETCIKSLRYFEKIDAVRIEYDADLTILVSAAKKNSTALLYAVIGELYKWGEADLRDIYLKAEGRAVGSWLDRTIRPAK
jgi:hypothetical protein